MDDLVPLRPDESGQHTQHKHQRRLDRSCAKSRQVFDVHMCLEALSRLPGLVLMGYVRPAQANAIRGTLETILRHYHQSGSTRTASPLHGIDIMSILRTHPHLINLFEPLLTDEQLESLMQEAKDGDDREV